MVMKTKQIAVRVLLALGIGIGVATAAELPRSAAPKDVELYIISPKDGETVTSPVTVRFGLRGMGIAPAGVAMENTGSSPSPDRHRSAALQPSGARG